MSIVGKLGGIEGQQTISEVVTPGGGSGGAGLQLYGPYAALSNGAMIAANTSTDIEFTDLENINGETVSYPQDTTAMIFLNTFSCSETPGICAQRVSPPGVHGGTWYNAQMTVFNTTAATAGTDNVYIVFYSTVEFPLES